MTIRFEPYGVVLTSMARGKLKLDSDVIKAMLTTTSYTPNINAHQYKSDITNEIVGTGYVAGGKVCGGIFVSFSALTMKVTAGNLSWPASSFLCRYLVLYDDSTGETDNEKILIGHADLRSGTGSDPHPNNQTLFVAWDSTAGMFTEVIGT